MNIKKVLLTGMMISVLSCYAFSQTTQNNSTEVLNLTIEDAVAMAIQNNVSIKQSKMNLELLEKKNKYSWNSVSPSFSLSSSFSEPLSKVDDWSFSVSGAINLKLSPALGTSMKSAKLAYEAGLVSYNESIRSVEKSIRMSFYQLLNAKETISSKQLNLESSKRTYETNLAKYNRGSLDQLTVLNSQYSYESAIPEVYSAQIDYQNKLDVFKQSLGLDISTPIEIIGTLDDALIADFENDELVFNVEDLPSIKKAKAKIEETENSLASSKISTYAPTVSFAYSQGYKSAVSVMTKERENGLSNDNNSVTASISIPIDGLLPWSGTGVGNTGALVIENLENTLKGQKMELEASKVTSMISVQNSYNLIKNSQQMLKLNKANFELAQKTYDMTLAAYNSGSKDLASLQSAQDNLEKMKFTIQSQKLNIITSVMNLEDTLGIPFGSLK